MVSKSAARDSIKAGAGTPVALGGKDFPYLFYSRITLGVATVSIIKSVPSRYYYWLENVMIAVPSLVAGVDVSPVASVRILDPGCAVSVFEAAISTKLFSCGQEYDPNGRSHARPGEAQFAYCFDPSSEILIEATAGGGADPVYINIALQGRMFPIR